MNNIINKLTHLHVNTQMQKNNILKELINSGVKPNIATWIIETVDKKLKSQEKSNTQTKRPQLKRSRVNTSNITKQMQCSSINNHGGKKQKK